MPRFISRHRVPVLGAALLALALIINFGFYFNVFQGWFASGGQTVHAIFRDAGQLYPGDDVRVNGVIEGKVKKITLLPSGEGSDVELQVSHSVSLYQNASASLRWRTLLGGAFYVGLTPGTGKAGPLNGPIRKTSSQVELDDVTTVISGRAKQGLVTTPKQLAKTLNNPAVTARLLSTAAAQAPSLAAGLKPLRGSDADVDLQAVIDNADKVTTALITPDNQLRTLVQGVAATLQTTGAHAADIESILRQGPAVTDGLIGTLANLDTTLGQANTLVSKLDKPAPDVAPTLRALNPTLTKTARLLVSAKPLVTSLKPAVKAVVHTSYVGVPLLNSLQPSVDRLNGVILPYFQKKDPGTGYSTTDMIGGTAAAFSAAASEMDENGHYIRFPATVGTQSIHLPCDSSIIDPDQTSVLSCDTLQQAINSYLSYLPVGSPGR